VPPGRDGAAPLAPLPPPVTAGAPSWEVAAVPALENPPEPPPPPPSALAVQPAPPLKWTALVLPDPPAAPVAEFSAALAPPLARTTVVVVTADPNEVCPPATGLPAATM